MDEDKLLCELSLIHGRWILDKQMKKMEVNILSKHCINDQQQIQ
jgi:hypothetical protein